MQKLTLRASSAQRHALCPGSAMAADGIPEGTASDGAEFGSLVHAIIAYRFAPSSPLPKPETPGSFEEAANMAETLIARFERGAGFKIAEATILAVEDPLSWHAWTGHPDMILAHGGKIHILDWKCGWQGTPDAADNAQLRVYAVAEYYRQARTGETEHTPIVCHVVTPGEHTVTEYDSLAIIGAWRELDQIAEDCAATDAPRNPSPKACQYCRAFGTDRCPETRELPATAQALAAANLPAVLATIEPGRLAAVEATLELADKLHNAVKEEIQRRLAAQEAVPGFRLDPGRKTSKVTDVGAAFAALPELDQATFLRACTLSLPELAKATKGKLGATEAAARRAVNDRLAALIVEKEGSPVLTRT